MKLTLKRIALNSDYTIGKLYIDNEYFCDILEDTVRDLNRNGKFDQGEIKIPDKTAIPYGTYQITLGVKSPKYSNYSKYPWAKKYNGYIPRLLNVNSFDGILIHPGNKHEHTSGCLLPGQNKVKGQVLNSTLTFDKLMTEHLLPANQRNEQIFIEII